jgi:hypothetical protein
MTLRELKDKLERILDELNFEDNCPVRVEVPETEEDKTHYPPVTGIRFECGKNGESVTLILE